MIKKKNKEEKFVMPKWMDCTWRRIACNRDDCVICGKIKIDREKHIARGEDPDSMKSAMEDVGSSFKEVLQMIKKDAAKHGIDITNIDNIEEPPEPQDFPLHNKAMKWRKYIYKMAEEAEEELEAWLFTEAGADLLWYANTLPAKTYRQLCNRWHLNNGDEYGEEDYEYTKYVLIECLSILKKSLNDLRKENSKFNLAMVMLTAFEKDILGI